jgi:hypothetical protein
MDQAHHQSQRVAERDRWLLRSRRLRRGVAVVAATLVLGFGGLAAASSGSSSASESTAHSRTVTSSAPQSTSQTPTVTSGGS